jgi:hypothetical protein
MARIFHPLIMLMARATQAELAQMVDCLKTETPCPSASNPYYDEMRPNRMANRAISPRRPKKMSRLRSMGQLTARASSIHARRRAVFSGDGATQYF